MKKQLLLQAIQIQADRGGWFQTASWMWYPWLVLFWLATAALAADSSPLERLADQFGNLAQAGRYAEAEAVGRQGLALSQQIGGADSVSDWLVDSRFESARPTEMAPFDATGGVDVLGFPAKSRGRKPYRAFVTAAERISNEVAFPKMDRAEE